MLNNVTLPTMRPFALFAANAVLAVGLFSNVALQAGEPVAAPLSKSVNLEKAIDWREHTIAPVADPILFEDAVIRNEFRPVFGYQNIADDFATQGGDLQVYGMQLRWAVTPRFALMMVKGGWNEFHPGVGPDADGLGDLGVGMKYALIDLPEHQFILTPGVTYEFPTGDEEVYQGNGDGLWNFFVSSQKGFGDFHLQANVGIQVPNEDYWKSTILHYHLQADYYVCSHFIPFVVANGYTVVNEGGAAPLDSEGYDLVNFGSAYADGETQITVGGGFRSHLTSYLDFGFAYTKSVGKKEGFIDDRFIVDFVIKF